MEFNIVSFIENNPLNVLSKNYQSRLINKIKDNFKVEEQKLFITSFYTYLNYDADKDFVIDLQKVWKWLGFTRIDPAKRVLTKHFKVDIHYKIIKIFAPQVGGTKLAPQVGGIIPQVGGIKNLSFASPETTKVAPQVGGATFKKKNGNAGNGGLNKQQILMTVNTFKKLCMKSNTKKADEIHDYYVNLERVLHETVTEESESLLHQLENKEKEIEDKEKENAELKRRFIKPKKEIIEDKNVIYILSTPESEKTREYAIGKTTDINKRLDDYNHNKLHDFSLVYCKPCGCIKIMDIMESLVLTKLGKYRCKADRDVFLLPETHTINTFISVIEECVNFFKDVKEEDVVYPKRTLKVDKESEKRRHKVYREEHKEEIKQKQKEYYEENKDYLSVIKKEYYKNNKEEINEKNRQYYEKNKEKVIECNMKYYNDNKEEVLEQRKEFYEKNKEHILNERKEYYKKNYETKIKAQRQAKETCECGIIVSHYGMKRHKKSKRHALLIEKKANIK